MSNLVMEILLQFQFVKEKKKVLERFSLSVNHVKIMSPGRKWLSFKP